MGGWIRFPPIDFHYKIECFIMWNLKDSGRLLFEQLCVTPNSATRAGQKRSKNKVQQKLQDCTLFFVNEWMNFSFHKPL